DHPKVSVVGYAIELLAGLDALTVDDLLFDHFAGCRRGPIDRPRIDAFFPHFADATLWHCEIAQPLQGALDIAIGVGCRHAAPALGCTHRHDKIDLRALNVGAVDAEQRRAGMNVLAGPANEQIFDEPVRPHRDDGQTGFIVHHRADRADQTHDDSRLDRSRPHAAALDLFRAYLDGL